MRCPNTDAPGAAAGARQWQVQEFSDDSDRARFAAMARTRLPIAEFYHDVEWLEAERQPNCSIRLLAAYNGDELVGLLPIGVSSTHLEYKIGNVSLFRTRLRQFTFSVGPVSAEKDQKASFASAMDCLPDIMPSDAVAFAEWVPCGSEFDDLLSAPDTPLRTNFHVLKWGQPNRHCKIDWVGSTETYLNSLGPESRRNLKRYSKKLFADAGLTPRVERFESSEEAARFLEDGIRISNNTYQKNLLNLGLSHGGPVERSIQFAAARSSFLGYILYLCNEPVAFHYGFIFGSTLFARQMGYDPAHARYQVGSVLFFRILQDIEALNMPIKTIDYSAGANTEFKLRTSNRQELFQNYYLFKRNARGFALFAAISALDAFVKGLKLIANRARLTNVLRRRFRKSPRT
jgi:hypothetical protein